MEKIQIFDTTLRDGEQSPGCSMSAGEKLLLARQLEKLGADTLKPVLLHRLPEILRVSGALVRKSVNQWWSPFAEW